MPRRPPLRAAGRWLQPPTAAARRTLLPGRARAAARLLLPGQREMSSTARASCQSDARSTRACAEVARRARAPRAPLRHARRGSFKLLSFACGRTRVPPSRAAAFACGARINVSKSSSMAVGKLACNATRDADPRTHASTHMHTGALKRHGLRRRSSYANARAGAQKDSAAETSCREPQLPRRIREESRRQRSSRPCSSGDPTAVNLPARRARFLGSVTDKCSIRALPLPCNRRLVFESSDVIYGCLHSLGGGRPAAECPY